ncbi:MAG TPA: hypothetical protein VEJ18_20185 [Planctomycetota bacterium]|nr:hypothetical protein [Planctomycetota bacterium]
MIIALAAALAVAQSEAAVVQVNRNALAETQEGVFTIRSVDPYPSGFRIMGFVSGKDQAVKWDGPFNVQEKTPVITRAHVGQEWWVCLGVFAYGTPEQQAQTNALEGKINEKLQLRKTKFTELAAETAKVNGADDQALAALKTARTTVASLVNAGSPGAEKAAEDALKAGWTNADNAWKAQLAGINKWHQLLGEIRSIETELRALIKAGTLYYYLPTETNTLAFELHFLDEETCTSKSVHKVRRELMFVRPQGMLDRIALDAVPAGRVSVARKQAVERVGNKADVVHLELQGQAQISGGLKDVEIRALVNGERIKSMPHTNTEYRNLKLSRQPDLEDTPDHFAYDDLKTVVPDKHLLVFLRGNVFPPVSRYAAFRNLRDHLRFPLPAVEDSDGAQAIVKPLPRRALHTTDKKVATVEFAEIKLNPKTAADKLLVASYTGGGGTGGEGTYQTVFAYNGLPKTSNHFGIKTLKVVVTDIDGATAELESREIRYFFTFSKKNRPAVPGAPATSVGSINGLWYYSEPGAGGAPAVPGFQWDGIKIGANALTVQHAGVKAGEKGTLGECTLALPRVITLFGTALAETSTKAQGYWYHFHEFGTITSLDGETPVQKNVEILIEVPEVKRFGPLVAHVWRHELRHAEQFEKLARLANDTTDRDGDFVFNLQEIQNKTDVTKDRTWPTFPISTKSAKLDQEVDCEIQANGVMGTPANDWAMDTRKEGKTLTRLGTQWTD